MKYTYCIIIVAILSLLSQCSEPESGPHNREPTSRRVVKDTLSVHGALPQMVKSPSDNPTSDAKVELGRLLFYDPILSGSKDIACATCHHPDNGYAEFKDLSIGTNGKGLGSKRRFNNSSDIQLMNRNSQTILNTAFNGMDTKKKYMPTDAPMFWDSRVSSLELQALEPILAFEEMRGERIPETEILDSVIHRLTHIPDYVQLFDEVFNESNPISEVNMAKAIAAFERTLITSETRFDKYISGDDSAISLSEQEGYRLFIAKGCGKCHNGPMFSDYKPHSIGVPHNEKLSELDKGMEDRYKFRTPSLRNLRFTAPYMHNGQFDSLKEVLEFYEDVASGRNRHKEVSTGALDPFIKQLNLRTNDIGPIISFLNTLSDSNFDKKIPEAVPSGLQVGGNIH